MASGMQRARKRGGSLPSTRSRRKSATHGCSVHRGGQQPHCMRRWRLPCQIIVAGQPRRGPALGGRPDGGGSFAVEVPSPRRFPPAPLRCSRGCCYLTRP
eukprot:3408109-Alexandrium_andersonii.AAC.1